MKKSFVWLEMKIGVRDVRLAPVVRFHHETGFTTRYVNDMDMISMFSVRK